MEPTTTIEMTDAGGGFDLCRNCGEAKCVCHDETEIMTSAGADALDQWIPATHLDRVAALIGAGMREITVRLEGQPVADVEAIVTAAEAMAADVESVR